MIRFLLQVTAYSRQQLTRLIHQYLRAGVIQQRTPHKPAGFKQKYTATDIALLAKMDERYDTPSGAVIKKPGAPSSLYITLGHPCPKIHSARAT